MHIVSTTEECNRIVTTTARRRALSSLLSHDTETDDDVYDGGTSERTEKAKLGQPTRKGEGDLGHGIIIVIITWQCCMH